MDQTYTDINLPEGHPLRSAVDWAQSRRRSAIRAVTDCRDRLEEAQAILADAESVLAETHTAVEALRVAIAAVPEWPR